MGSEILLAEFESAHDLLKAAEKIRDAGYKKWDCHTPFPVHGLDRAMGLRRTILPWICLGGGLTGCAIALVMQLWMNGIDYRLIVSGKPFFSVPANIPITFELTVLLAAFGAFFGMLILNNLPLHYHPLHRSERFRRATSDRFFISIEADDPAFDGQKTEAFMKSLGPSHLEVVSE